MYEAPTIIGTCTNCIAPGSLSVTLAVILVGAGIALTVEQRKLSALSPRSRVRLGPATPLEPPHESSRDNTNDRNSQKPYHDDLMPLERKQSRQA